MPMHTDFAKPEVRRFLAQRKRLTLNRAVAYVTIAWCSFDIWYSGVMQRLAERQRDVCSADIGKEIAIQANLRKRLAEARRVVA